jgi:polyhydroxyalkanoate synthesis regulator phasin
MQKHYKKGLMVGLGLAALALKDAKKRVDQLIKQGHLTKEEGERLLKDVRRFTSQKEGEIERVALAEAKVQMKIIRAESKKRIIQLRQELEKLEKRL